MPPLGKTPQAADAQAADEFSRGEPRSAVLARLGSTRRLSPLTRTSPRGCAHPPHSTLSLRPSQNGSSSLPASPPTSRDPSRLPSHLSTLRSSASLHLKRTYIWAAPSGLGATLTGANSSRQSFEEGDGGPRRARLGPARPPDRARPRGRGRGRRAGGRGADAGGAPRRRRSPRPSGDALGERVLRLATGLGPLEPLLADPRVDEVMVNGPGEVWVERGGRIEPAAVAFGSRGGADARDRADPRSARAAGGRGVAAVRRAAARRLARERGDPAAVAVRGRA